MTLHAVGEEDGQSEYSLRINGSAIGSHFTCPQSQHAFEEGSAFMHTWNNVTIDSGDIIEVSAEIASADGKEYSRGRWSGISFTPADTATLKANQAATPTVVHSESRALVQPRQPDGSGTVEIAGELKQWHKVTLTLDGPFAAELDNAPNPFTDYDFTVTFIHASGDPSYQVPGYFAADGTATESSATAGTKWRAHLSPDKAGLWNYTVSFNKGKRTALDGGGNALPPYAGLTGSFNIAKTDKSGRDFRSQGRLEYVELVPHGFM